MSQNRYSAEMPVVDGLLLDENMEELTRFQVFQVYSFSPSNSTRQYSKFVPNCNHWQFFITETDDNIGSTLD